MPTREKGSTLALQPDKRACPLCGKPVEDRFRPFCSKRCADLDLAHWLRGDYAIAARKDPEDEEGDTPKPSGPGARDDD